MPDIVATYRVQLNKDFTFYHLIDTIPYLHRLGISHVYCSPVFESVKGSVHGYDILDPLKISGERGGEEGLMRLDEALSGLDPPMKMILDIVPNHMSTHPENPYWYDVLEKGVGSAYWRFFDMRVRPGHRIRLPCLDKELIRLIRSGDAGIERRRGKIQFRLYQKYYPLKGSSLVNIDDIESPLAEETANIVRQQNYEFVHWLKGLENLSYRRFFDVIDLVGVRMEDENVYKYLHKKMLDLKRELKTLDGVRVDHVDGLTDPGGYLKKLHTEFSNIWVEKILSRGESLPRDWPVRGTTGYEFIDHINHLFVDREGFAQITAFWHREVENSWENFGECLTQSREKVLTDLFLPEFQRVTGLLAIDERTWFFWKALTMMLPVYRTYVSQGACSEDDIGWVEKSLKKSGLFPGWERRVATLLLQPQTTEQIKGMQEWQQLTGPLMAKGLEDTAHYRYSPLAALNEIGCTPELQETGPEHFMTWSVERSKAYSETLNTTSTHDTKRSEDARHRLYALSSLPEQWIEFVKMAQNINEYIRPAGFPRRVEYFFYQAVIATWPLAGERDDLYKERIVLYMSKATKEMKLETSWLRPNEEFDKKVADFVRHCLSSRTFIDHTDRFVGVIGPRGALVSLAVLTLKILSGGVPDIYQGTDLWNFYLVDPDNRHPVEYEGRARLLAELGLREQGEREKFLSELCRNWKDGAVKLWLTKALLEIRREAVGVDAGKISLLPVSGSRRSMLMSWSLSTTEEKTGWIITVPVLLDKNLNLDGLLFSENYWAETRITFPQKNKFFDCLEQAYLPAGSDIQAGALLNHFPVSIVKFS